MRVGQTSTLGFALLTACSRDHSEAVAFRKLEAEIAAALTVRVGARIVVRCPTPIACIAIGPDDARIPILLAAGTPQWTWRVDGLLVISDVLEAYLNQEVADLGSPQGVRCAPRLRVVRSGDRVDCWLDNGGKAFVTIGADGQTSIEIELAKAAAEARSEVHSARKDEALSRLSRALEHEGNSDGEEATFIDAGVDDGGDDSGTLPPR